MSNGAEESPEHSPVHAPLPIKTFVTSVARIEQLAHPFTRVTFRGGDLEHFQSIGPDQFLYLLLPPAGQSDLTIDATFEWSQYQTMPESQRPIGAYYTVRHHRPDAAELDIDIVRHGHEGQVGRWLNQCQARRPRRIVGSANGLQPTALDTSAAAPGRRNRTPSNRRDSRSWTHRSVRRSNRRARPRHHPQSPRSQRTDCHAARAHKGEQVQTPRRPERTATNAG